MSTMECRPVLPEPLLSYPAAPGRGCDAGEGTDGGWTRVWEGDVGRWGAVWCRRVRSGARPMGTSGPPCGQSRPRTPCGLVTGKVNIAIRVGWMETPSVILAPTESAAYFQHRRHRRVCRWGPADHIRGRAIHGPWFVRPAVYGGFAGMKPRRLFSSFPVRREAAEREGERE